MFHKIMKYRETKMKFGGDLPVIVLNEYLFARICNCCGDQDMFKIIICSHFELYCFIQLICLVHNK